MACCSVCFFSVSYCPRTPISLCLPHQPSRHRPLNPSPPASPPDLLLIFRGFAHTHIQKHARAHTHTHTHTHKHKQTHTYTHPNQVPSGHPAVLLLFPLPPPPPPPSPLPPHRRRCRRQFVSRFRAPPPRHPPRRAWWPKGRGRCSDGCVSVTQVTARVKQTGTWMCASLHTFGRARVRLHIRACACLSLAPLRNLLAILRVREFRAAAEWPPLPTAAP